MLPCDPLLLHQVGWKALALAFCFAGMATKGTNGVRTDHGILCTTGRSSQVPLPGAWRQNGSFYLGLASSWLLLATLVVTTHGRGGSAGFASSASEWNYVLTQCGAIVTYLRLSFWPNPLIFDYGPGLVQNLADVCWQAALVAALSHCFCLGLGPLPGCWVSLRVVLRNPCAQFQFCADCYRTDCRATDVPISGCDRFTFAPGCRQTDRQDDSES